MTDNNLSANTESQPQKIDVIGEKTAKNYRLIKELLKTNIKGVEIAKLTDYSPEHISRLKKKLLNIQLVTPKRLKKAIKSIEFLSDIDNINANDKIKPSDVIAASKIFIDRQYPITQVVENKAVSINLDIDMSEYMLLAKKDNSEQCMKKHTLLTENDKIIDINDTDKAKSLKDNEG